MTRRVVTHRPVWAPAQLRINAAGDTRPGFECVHPLENGNGLCLSNVFEIEQAVGDHSCVVDNEGGAMTDEKRVLSCGCALMLFACKSGKMLPIGHEAQEIPYGRMDAMIWCVQHGWVHMPDDEFERLTAGGHA